MANDKLAATPASGGDGVRVPYPATKAAEFEIKTRNHPVMTLAGCVAFGAGAVVAAIQMQDKNLVAVFEVGIAVLT